jgi:hypothetical protein
MGSKNSSEHSSSVRVNVASKRHGGVFTVQLPKGRAGTTVAELKELVARGPYPVEASDLVLARSAGSAGSSAGEADLKTVAQLGLRDDEMVTFTLVAGYQPRLRLTGQLSADPDPVAPSSPA